MTQNEKNIEYEAHIRANAFDNNHNDYFFYVDLIVYQEDSRYIAQCPALDLSSSGDNHTEAIQNFYEAFQLHVECCIELDTLFEDFKKHGWTITANTIIPPKLSELMQRESFKKILDSDIPFNRVIKNISVPCFA